MRKRTREILALVLLGALVVIGIGAMGYYILVGHNWNVAASTIDESVGQMDGYTVFLYEGTGLSEDAEALGSEAKGESRASVSASSPASTTASALSSFAASVSESTPVTLGDAVEAYREKGATVFTLDVGELSRYSEPLIVAKGGKRIGLFSVTEPVRKTVVRRVVRDFNRQGVDCIVALTDDARLCKPLVSGLSIIVCSDGREGVPDGEWRGSTYCVGVPVIGKVGAVVMSPSGVLTSKTVTEL